MPKDDFAPTEWAKRVLGEHEEKVPKHAQNPEGAFISMVPYIIIAEFAVFLVLYVLNRQYSPQFQKFSNMFGLGPELSLLMVFLPIALIVFVMLVFFKRKQ